MTARRRTAFLGAAALIVLHLDFWRAPDPSLVLGWMPVELAWRLGWMALAWVYLEWFTRRAWEGDGR